MSYRKLLNPAARQLRNNMTQPERIFWHRVRCNQINGIRFHRQRVLGPYIVDFYAPSINLVVELDGAQHYEEMHEEADKIRDAYLNENGLLVKRYSNLEIYNHIENVIEDIFNISLELKKAH